MLDIHYRTVEPVRTDTHNNANANTDDASLLSRARAGDTQAFGRLLADNYAEVCRIVALRVRPAEIEEVAQEAVVRAFLSIDQLRDPSRFRSWLARIAHHVCIDWIRRRYRSAAFEPLADDAVIVGPPGDDHDDDSEASLPILIAAITRLKPPHATTLLLRGLEGFSYRRIARELRVSLPCVKSYLHRARRHLREGTGREASAIRALAYSPNLR